MINKPDIEARFEELLKEATDELKRVGWDGSQHAQQGHYARDSVHIHVLTAGLNLLKRVCGTDSDHYIQMKQVADHDRGSNNGYYLPRISPILQAAYEDWKGGYLFDLRSLVTAEVFDDLLEQAEHLLENGFYIPAASLAGAVLEDSLRTLSEREGIAIPKKTNIDGLTQNLYTAKVYNVGVNKAIIRYADTRNNADHGWTDRFKIEDVEDMVRWVRRFTTEHLV